MGERERETETSDGRTSIQRDRQTVGGRERERERWVGRERERERESE